MIGWPEYRSPWGPADPRTSRIQRVMPSRWSCSSQTLYHLPPPVVFASHPLRSPSHPRALRLRPPAHLAIVDSPLKLASQPLTRSFRSGASCQGSYTVIELPTTSPHPHEATVCLIFWSNYVKWICDIALSATFSPEYPEFYVSN